MLRCGKIGREIGLQSMQPPPPPPLSSFELHHFDPATNPMSSKQRSAVRAMLFHDCFSGELEKQSDVSLDGECWALSETTAPQQQQQQQHFVAVLFLQGSFLFNVCTARSSRGQGWMKRLFCSFLDEWKLQNPRRKVLRLNVWKANSPAIALYRQLGFREEKSAMIRNDVSEIDEASWTMAIRPFSQN